MKNLRIRPIVASVLALLLCGAWAVLIFVALHVSSIVLNTLDMIIELAQVS